MALPTIFGEFRLGGDPELEFTPSGKAVAKASIVSNSRKKTQSGEWEDGPPSWLRLNVWGQMAEHFVESCEKGSLIFVSGRFEHRQYTNAEGETRYSAEVTADTVGPALAFATAKVTKAQRTSAPAPADPGAPTQGGAQPAADPWATPVDDSAPPF
jgi:single-strand DNA-binding protein